jgi:hypothetical protein
MVLDNEDGDLSPLLCIQQNEESFQNEMSAAESLTS